LIICFLFHSEKSLKEESTKVDSLETVQQQSAAVGIGSKASILADMVPFLLQRMDFISTSKRIVYRGLFTKGQYRMDFAYAIFAIIPHVLIQTIYSLGIRPIT